MPGRILFVTGTDTGVGKTVVTAALAAAARGRVAVLKAAQTGLDETAQGDVDTVRRLAGSVTGVELARFPDPLAPATAARRAGAEPVRPGQVADAACRLAEGHELVLVEGAGGVLVPFDDRDGTLADAAAATSAPVLVVSHAGLGALNAAALTVRALRTRALPCPGVVLGSWPREPGPAHRCNLTDLPRVTGLPLLGALPEGMGGQDAAAFGETSRAALASCLGGEWDATTFTHRWAPHDRAVSTQFS